MPRGSPVNALNFTKFLWRTGKLTTWLRVSSSSASSGFFELNETHAQLNHLWYMYTPATAES